MAAEKDRITCHVLNTLDGTPAEGLGCTLSLVKVDLPAPAMASPTSIAPLEPHSYKATTNGDGRIAHWNAVQESLHPSLESFFNFLHRLGGDSAGEVRSTWNMEFKNVGRWYQERNDVDSFWGDVTVQFVVVGTEGPPAGRNYHVPLLLGPWSYSTYRGS